MQVLRSMKRTGIITKIVLLTVLLLSSASFARDLPRFRIKEEKARDLFRKGLTFFNSRRYNAAREYFYKALSVQPSFHLARIYLGDSYYYSGEWNGALEQWEYLNDTTSNAYPLVRQRSNLLRFQMSDYRDPGNYTYYKSYNDKNIKESGLVRPVDIHLDPVDGIYLLNYGSSNILNINSSGQVVKTWRGPLFNSFEGPLSFSKDKRNYYIADFSGDKIRILNNMGREIADFGETGSEPGQFRGPAGIYANDKNIYVSDSGNGRIQKFDKNGKYLLEIKNLENGQAMQYPFGITSDDGDGIFVSDSDTGLIYHFDYFGNTLGVIKDKRIQKPRNLSFKNNTLLIADENTGVHFYNTKTGVWKSIESIMNEERDLLNLKGAFSVKMDDSGVLYIARYLANSLDILVPRGLRTSNTDVTIENVESGNYPYISLFVRVKNRLGIPLRDLSNRQFIIYENDKRIGLIRSDNMRPYNNRVHMMVVREISPAMKSMENYQADNISDRLLAPIRIVDSVGVYYAGENVSRVYNGLERNVIKRKIREGKGNGSPNMGKAMFQAMTDLLNVKGSRNIVMIVSGEDYRAAFNQYSYSRILQYAKTHDIAVNFISLKEKSPSGSLLEKYKNMATETGGQFVYAYNDTDLKEFYSVLRSRKDDRYIITYKSNKEKNISDRFIDVRLEVNHLGTSGVGEAGYFSP